jgi:hypothetical protein
LLVAWKTRGILVAYFFNVEETAAYANVCFTDIFDAIDDCRADSSCDTVIVCFSYAT